MYVGIYMTPQSGDLHLPCQIVAFSVTSDISPELISCAIGLRHEHEHEAILLLKSNSPLLSNYVHGPSYMLRDLFNISNIIFVFVCEADLEILMLSDS